jgi:hypothetical protein
VTWEDRDRPASVNFSGLITVLVLAAGAIWVNLPLEGLRPPASAAGIPLTKIQDVDARLWQDPFGAVAKAREQRNAAGAPARVEAAPGKGLRPGGRKGYSHQPKTLQAVIAEQVSDAPVELERPLSILGVMVFGDATVGADEYRRRTRYAVLSALMSASYAPDDPEHIGYVRLKAKTGRPHIVPYEWFHSGGRRLLILWLDENALMQRPAVVEERGPLARLSKLMDEILGPYRNQARLDFIGPAGTDMLLEMAAELAQARRNPAGAAGNAGSMAFYSPFATISNGVVAHEFPECAHPEKRCDVEKLFTASPHGLRGFVRMNSSDAEVVEALFDELRQRRIGPHSEIAVIGEWDTRYALQLREEIGAAHRKGLRIRSPMTGSAEREHVHPFGYMRGLDGRVPDTDKKEGKKSDEKPRERLQVERPDGDAQVDYLRRLAGLMKQREQQLSREAGRKVRYRAVGVVGNDYYDKLLVLQALRPMFPDALFFTTDLYAAMLHPTDNTFTRNLIVGSGFGLTLHHKLQNGTPPFRDSYQTAAFLATRVALSAEGEALASDKLRAERSLRPTVWEVGRTRLFDLRPQVDKLDCSGPLDCNHVHDLGERHTGLEWRDVAWPALAAAVVLLVFFPGIVRWLKRSSRKRWFYTVFVPLHIIVPLLIALPAFSDARHPLGEPFAWFEGVSVWPSNLIRLAAFVIALVGLGYVFQSARNRIRECDRDFFLRHAPVATPAARLEGGRTERLSARIAARARLEWHLTRRRFARFWASDSSHRRLNAKAAWYDYKQSMGGTSIAVGASLELVCLWLFVSLILALSGAELTSPARSPISFFLNDVVVIAAVLVTQYLLVCVALVLRKTNTLGRVLTSRSQWPNSVRSQRGLPEASRMSQFDEWLSLSLLARQTEAINALVYFPFFALLLVVLARFRIFDNWSTPVSLTVVMALSFVYLIMAAFRVRRTAEAARSEALASLQEKLIFLQGSAHPEAASLAAQCRALIDHVRGLDRGAFMPIGQQPVARAFLGLVGGLSGAALLEYAALANF